MVKPLNHNSPLPRPSVRKLYDYIDEHLSSLPPDLQSYFQTLSPNEDCPETIEFQDILDHLNLSLFTIPAQPRKGVKQLWQIP